MKIALIAPVHKQPSQKWVDGLPKPESGVDVFIVDDSDGHIKIEAPNIRVFDYAQQKNEMSAKDMRGSYQYFAKNFHHSSACKNFGLWYAWEKGYDYVIVIDSDCNIEDKLFINKHIQTVSRWSGYGWENPLDELNVDKRYYPRGFPYEERDKNIALNLGLWNGLLDINGKDRDEYNSKNIVWNVDSQDRIATGIIPLSGMNLCVKRDAIPALMFLPNFDTPDGAKFRRHDDIMGGYIFQKLMKLAGECLSYGEPFVFHDSDVHPSQDAEEEEAMNRAGSYFYKLVDKAIAEIVPTEDYRSMFVQFSYAISPLIIETPFRGLIDSFHWFRQLYED